MDAFADFSGHKRGAVQRTLRKISLPYGNVNDVAVVLIEEEDMPG